MADKIEIDEKGNVIRTPVEDTKNTAPNLDTAPGNEQKPVAMPEKTMVKEINPQDGSPAIPSRAPEGGVGTSLEKELHKTDAEKQLVRDATDQRAKANTFEVQDGKANPPSAGVATVGPDATSAEFKSTIPSDVLSGALVDPQAEVEIPEDEKDSKHPQENTIEKDFPAGRAIKQANLSAIVHPGHQDQSELNRQIAAQEAGIGARGDATVELMQYVSQRRKGHIRRMQQVQLVLRNSSMDTQQQEKVLRQIGEIFAE